MVAGGDAATMIRCFETGLPKDAVRNWTYFNEYTKEKFNEETSTQDNIVLYDILL